MPDLFWTYPHPGPARPYRILLTRAEDHETACAVFGYEAHSNRVNACTTPALVALAQGLGANCVMEAAVEKLPSAYDRFYRADGTLDRAAMEAAGVDMS